jgi:hypothetical protein
MYLGFVLIFIGVATLLGSLMPWVIIPIFALRYSNIVPVADHAKKEIRRLLC